ncbi:MAG: hypothetical protein HQL21_01375 [Candidatus Omnitrophica bacterium]|nr:hypothetical protein [Candidatus Omnitrophota bacterium]
MLKQKCTTVVALLVATTANDGAVIISVSDDLVKKGMNAGTIIKKMASLFGGSGGGRPNMAQAGCNEPLRLLGAFEDMKKIVKESMTT